MEGEGAVGFRRVWVGASAMALGFGLALLEWMTKTMGLWLGLLDVRFGLQTDWLMAGAVLGAVLGGAQMVVLWRAGLRSLAWAPVSAVGSAVGLVVGLNAGTIVGMLAFVFTSAFLQLPLRLLGDMRFELVGSPIMFVLAGVGLNFAALAGGCISAALVGGALGVGQSVILKSRVGETQDWAWVTMLGGMRTGAVVWIVYVVLSIVTRELGKQWLGVMGEGPEILAVGGSGVVGGVLYGVVTGRVMEAIIRQSSTDTV